MENKIILDHSRIRKVNGRGPAVNAAGRKAEDPAKPIFFWFQDTPVGKELFLALYTKKCQWARCSFCSLPSVSSPKKVNPGFIIQQALFALHSLTLAQRHRVKRLFISNNGSVLNPETISPDALDRICELAHNHLPFLEIISFETRLETAGKKKMLYYLRRFQEWNRFYLEKGMRRVHYPVRLQISGGYETQDPYLRNDVLGKGYPEWLLQKFYSLCAEVQSETGTPVLVDENILLKPALGMSSRDAILETVQTILHLDRLGRYFHVPVSVRLNPTFVAEGSYLHAMFREKKYSPPRLRDVVKVLQKCRQLSVGIPIFIGLNEEKLAAPGGSFHRGTASDRFYYSILKKFNSTQDFRLCYQKP